MAATSSKAYALKLNSKEPAALKGEISSELDGKHKIFLSHSGAQKPFVRDLSLELERVNHFPFFDQNSDSLPKGESFPPIILKAARQCLVAVVVLSKEFLTSKWPMLELCEFVKAKRLDNPRLRLLPLFFRVSPADISKEAVENKWAVEWTKILPQTGLQASLQEWSESLRILRGTNGLDFRQFGDSLDAYREAIVWEICTMLPPPELFDTADIVGSQRLCKIVAPRLGEEVENVDDDTDVYALGLYASAGAGKSTLCKSLCNHFQTRYRGRVCHVELGRSDRLTSLKKVLRRLTRTSLHTISRLDDADEAQQILFECVSLQAGFLAIDNIQDDEASCEEARSYLKLPFCGGSKVLFTARTADILEKVLRTRTSCLSLPDLTFEEAAKILLQKGAPARKVSSFTQDEQKSIIYCVNTCSFPQKDHYGFDLDISDRQFHPLALRALGVFLHDVDHEDVLQWKKEIFHQYHNRFKLSVEAPAMFRILGLEFQKLTLSSKLLFLDLAFYAPIDCLKTPKERISWLANIHGENVFAIKMKLKELTRKGFLEEWNDETQTISMHDLYKEYASWFIDQGRDSDIRCLFEQFATSFTTLFQQKFPGQPWSSVIRASLPNSRFTRVPSEHTQKLSNIVVLQLYRSMTLAAIDIQKLVCLRHLEVSFCYQLKTLCSFDIEEGIISDVERNTNTTEGCLPELQYMILFSNPKLKYIPSLTSNSKLQQLIVGSSSNLLVFPQIHKLPKLTVMDIAWNGSHHIETLDIGLFVELQVLSITGPGEQDHWYNAELHTLITNQEWKMHLHGLGDLVKMEKLNLVSLPITKVAGLESLTSLTSLSLRNCLHLPVVPNMEGLGNMEWLDLSFTMIKEIKGVEKMFKLRTLVLVGCRDLQHLPNLEYLINLEAFDVSGCSNLRINFHLPGQKLIRHITDIVSPWVLFTRGMIEFQYGRPTRGIAGELSQTGTLKHRMESNGVLLLSCKYYRSSTLMLLDSKEGSCGTFADDVAFEEGEWDESRRLISIIASDGWLKSEIYGAPFEFDGECDFNGTVTFPLNSEDGLDDFLFDGTRSHVDIKTSTSTGPLGKDGDRMPETAVNTINRDEEDMSIPEMAFMERDFLSDIITKYLAREKRRRALYNVLSMLNSSPRRRDSEGTRVGGHVPRGGTPPPATSRHHWPEEPRVYSKSI